MLALFALLLQAQDPVDRLLSELRSPSKDRQEIARLALRAYGSSVADRLKKAELDPGQGPTKEDQEILAKLKSIRITIDMQNVPITAIAGYLHDVTGLDFQVDRSISDDDTIVTFKVADLALESALKLLLGTRRATHVVRGGKVHFTQHDEPEELPSRWPVRVATDPPQARALLPGLTADAPEEREKTLEAFRRLGLAAETVLWESLDSTDPELRSRAAELLRGLYAPPSPPLMSPLWKRLRAKTVSVDFKRSSAAELLATLSEVTGVPVVVDARRPIPDWTTTWKGWPKASELTEFLAVQLRLGYVVMDDWLLITPDPERVLGTTPFGSTWTDPEEARKIEALVRSLAGESATAREAALAEFPRRKPEVLGPLLEASRLLPPAAAARCLAARERYVAEKKLWLADEPVGTRLQTLTEEQQRFLEAPVDLVAVDQTLTEVLKSAGIPARVRSGGELKLSLWAKGMKTRTLLQALTGPNGLDYRLDEATVVIDSPARLAIK